MAYGAKPRGRLSGAVRAALSGVDEDLALLAGEDAKLLRWDEEATASPSKGDWPEGDYEAWEEKRQKKLAAALRAMGRG